MKETINAKIAALNESLIAGASATEILVAETEVKTLIGELNSAYRMEQFKAIVASDSPIMTALKTGNILGYKLAKEKNPITGASEYYLGDTVSRISLIDLEKAVGKNQRLCSAEYLTNELKLFATQFVVYKAKKLGKSAATISALLGTRKLMSAEVEAITTKTVAIEMQRIVDLVTATYDENGKLVRKGKVTREMLEYIESTFNTLDRAASTVKLGNLKKIDSVFFDICRWIALGIEPEAI